jgi:hypothetical protein
VFCASSFLFVLVLKHETIITLQVTPPCLAILMSVCGADPLEVERFAYELFYYAPNCFNNKDGHLHEYRDALVATLLMYYANMERDFGKDHLVLSTMRQKAELAKIATPSTTLKKWGAAIMKHFKEENRKNKAKVEGTMVVKLLAALEKQSESMEDIKISFQDLVKDLDFSKMSEKIVNLGQNLEDTLGSVIQAAESLAFLGEDHSHLRSLASKTHKVVLTLKRKSIRHEGKLEQILQNQAILSSNQAVICSQIEQNSKRAKQQEGMLQFICNQLRPQAYPQSMWPHPHPQNWSVPLPAEQSGNSNDVSSMIMPIQIIPRRTIQQAVMDPKQPPDGDADELAVGKSWDYEPPAGIDHMRRDPMRRFPVQRKNIANKAERGIFNPAVEAVQQTNLLVDPGQQWNSATKASMTLGSAAAPSTTPAPTNQKHAASRPPSVSMQQSMVVSQVPPKTVRPKTVPPKTVPPKTVPPKTVPPEPVMPEPVMPKPVSPPLKQTFLQQAPQEDKYFLAGFMAMSAFGFVFDVVKYGIRLKDDYWSEGQNDHSTQRDKARKIYAFCMAVAGRQSQDGKQRRHDVFLTNWKRLEVEETDYRTNLKSLQVVLMDVQNNAYVELKELCEESGAKWNSKMKKSGNLTVTAAYNLLEKVKNKRGRPCIVNTLIEEARRKYSAA